ncbi:phosphoglycerate dehydrogenase [Pseudoclavibacter sp. VKM Ac-2888]|uniref:phosphoglycerate dehydrogenase n=1 Tax=Pseudoclavibacter sp. VKM Ac-2888 TaxID=2783830 RepID=UPI00188D7BD8|nr:phosphoglycerate dehydrogenase [Pseudoclavibacter sp. VKM Ac-2888]MBF4550031.1 phosphoglycerate dehydrogenase [Pseudoclavibacter sp. VKM Ac-2888]
MRILITPTSLSRTPDAEVLAPLRDMADELIFNTLGRPLTSAELAEALPGIDGVIAGLDTYDAAALAGADRLRVISRYGVGVNNVDLAAAAGKGIHVTRTPGANASAVAELAIGLAFAVAREIPRLHAEVADGGWPRGSGIELGGRTFGVVGFGAIGRIVAERARGIGMHVLAYDPFVPAAAIAETGAAPASLDELFRAADVVSLHVPLLESTRHVADAARIAAMKPGAILLNTSRGGLIDEAAAREALDAGHLFGVGLDAYETEPPQDSPLLGHPRVVATPHSGAHTAEAVARMASGAIQNLVEELSGRPSVHRV